MLDSPLRGYLPDLSVGQRPSLTAIQTWENPAFIENFMKQLEFSFLFGEYNEKPIRANAR